MPLDDFTVLTEQDKRHFAYGLCVLGAVGAGATFGTMAGGLTLPGAAGGLVIGLFACRAVEEPLKQKLFGANVPMSQQEFLALAHQTKKQFPQLSRSQVLDLLAASRTAANKEPTRYRC